MKKIKVSIPDSLDEISIVKFRQINEILESKTDDIDKSFQLIQVITNLDLDSITKINEASMLKLGAAIQLMFENEYSGEIPKQFEKLKLIDFEKMTLGKFIDLHNLLKDKYENAEYILCQLFDEQEVYNGLDYKDADKFKSFSAGAYIKLFEQVAKFYHSVFEEYGLNKAEIVEDVPKTNWSSFQNKWGYYILVANLANNDVLKIDAVTKLHFREALTFNIYSQDYNRVNV